MKRALATAIVILSLATATVAFTQSVGTRLGDARGPQQPVLYSHKAHVGKLGMNCLYCHYGADKSPVANVPAVSLCMGCHKISRADKPEVMKLAGYYERGEPVPWVKVNWLPEHVKFNHKRHFAAGVQCTECHGPVQEMDVYYQYNSLKMGWCIECHRRKLDDPKFPASMDCLSCHH
ncbi:MAG: hypothetical protein A2W00_12130 [Candidatus Eisenbacteria bacterium RBG_16_71_46]|nr:MAG: hypothetical protein A2W00_12130 [Candidatus Eisenbacteria bacterium RBG_16_71_46]